MEKNKTADQDEQTERRKVNAGDSDSTVRNAFRIRSLSVVLVTSILVLGMLMLALPSLGQTGGPRKSVSSVLKFGWTEKDPKVKRKYMTVEVGDSTKTVFDPSFTLTAFNGECWFRINLSTAKHLMSAAG